MPKDFHKYFYKELCPDNIFAWGTEKLLVIQRDDKKEGKPVNFETDVGEKKEGKPEKKIKKMAGEQTLEDTM